MYILKVVFLTGQLLVGNIESKVACDDMATRIAALHDTDFQEAICTGPDGTSSLTRVKP